MATKFETEMQTRGERVVREHNIAKINGMIEECESLLAVMPGDTQEERQDLEFVRSRRDWLQDMKADEQHAYDATSMESTVDDVMKYMPH